MRLLECLLIKNTCYQRYHNDHLIPTGITVHSTDLAGGVLWRWVQPADGQSIGLKDGDTEVSAERMIQILGKNNYGTAWNRPDVDACVHAFLGKCADGSYAAAKTLDYTNPCWGGGFGTKGSYDGRAKVNGEKVPREPLHINFEMVEDEANPSKEHCRRLYELAVEFCAYLCRLFPTIRIKDIVSHKEANARGYASGHGDPEDYWQRCGMSYTMDGFRADVAAALAAAAAPLSFVDVPEDKYYYEAVRWAYENKIVYGVDKTHFKPNSSVKRGDMCVMLKKLYELIKGSG